MKAWNSTETISNLSSRHMPRAVVYGPITLGGMGIMDLRVEQPAYAFKTMVGHMRRDDKAGRVIVANLYDTQAEVGISTPFYKVDRKRYTYVTQNTRWYYIWKMCNEYNINLQIHCMWTPKAKVQNDRNLMEDALKDKYFFKKQNWKLEVINNCRRYLGVYYISEIMDDNGKVRRQFLDGEDKPKTDLPCTKDMRKPPKLAWAEWKCFIFRNYLIKGYQVDPPIGPPILNVDNGICKRENKIMSRLTRDQNIETLIAKLPHSIGSLLQKLQTPMDDGASLYESMIDGELIGASDGSLRKENGLVYGGYAFSLQSTKDDKGRMIGYASTPRSNDMTSLTSEMYGVLATTVCVYCIWKQNQHRYPGISTFPAVKVYLDNKEAIDKANAKTTKLNVSEHLKPEYDLETTLWDIQSILPVKIKYIWVKGHQNELKDGTKIFGPFPRDVQLNIDMDYYASKGCQLPCTPRAMYWHTKMAVYGNDEAMANNIELFLYEKNNGSILHSYVAEKFDWDEETMADIQWKALGEVLKAYSAHRQRKTIQMMYEWQNDGMQKMKIDGDDGKCPACEETETTLHHVYCLDEKMMTERKKQMSIMQKTMKKFNTYPGIISTIQQLLCQDQKEVIETFPLPSTYTDQLLLEAATMQHKLGCHALPKGFISTKWALVQQEWCSVTNKRYNMDRWTNSLIKALQDFTHAMWTKRNDVLHGETESEQIEIVKMKCKKRIRELYKRSRRKLSLEDKKLFQMPLAYRLKGSNAGMTLWIERAEMIFQQREQDEQNTVNTKYWIFKQNKKWLKLVPTIT